MRASNPPTPHRGPQWGVWWGVSRAQWGVKRQSRTSSSLIRPLFRGSVERETGFEPATSTLAKPIGGVRGGSSRFDSARIRGVCVSEKYCEVAAVSPRVGSLVGSIEVGSGDSMFRGDTRASRRFDLLSAPTASVHVRSGQGDEPPARLGRAPTRSTSSCAKPSRCRAHATSRGSFLSVADAWIARFSAPPKFGTVREGPPARSARRAAAVLPPRRGVAACARRSRGFPRRRDLGHYDVRENPITSDELRTPGLNGVMTTRGLVLSDRWDSAWPAYAAGHRKKLPIAA